MGMQLSSLQFAVSVARVMGLWVRGLDDFDHLVMGHWVMGGVTVGFRCGGASLRRLRGRLGIHIHALPVVGGGRDTLHVRIGHYGKSTTTLSTELRGRVRTCRTVFTL